MMPLMVRPPIGPVLWPGNQQCFFTDFLFWPVLSWNNISMKDKGNLSCVFLIMFIRFGAPFDKIIMISICLGIKQFSTRRVYCHLARIPYQSLINCIVLEILFISSQIYHFSEYSFRNWSLAVIQKYPFLGELDGKLLPHYVKVATLKL